MCIYKQQERLRYQEIFFIQKLSLPNTKPLGTKKSWDVSRICGIKCLTLLSDSFSDLVIKIKIKEITLILFNTQQLFFRFHSILRLCLTAIYSASRDLIAMWQKSIFAFSFLKNYCLQKTLPVSKLRCVYNNKQLLILDSNGYRRNKIYVDKLFRALLIDQFINVISVNQSRAFNDFPNAWIWLRFTGLLISSSSAKTLNFLYFSKGRQKNSGF